MAVIIAKFYLISTAKFMELLFGYAAGLLTLINPCVLPVLPIVLGSVLRQERYGPLVLAVGLSVSFTVLGVGVATLGPAIGVDADLMVRVGSVAMIVFGLVLIIPALNDYFSAAAAGISKQADQHVGSAMTKGLGGHFTSGLCLGAAWSPCIGPTLGGAISMASQGQSLLWVSAIMVSFSLGTSTIILVLAYGAREAIARRQAKLRRVARNSKTIMAIMLVGVGLAILFDLQKVLERMAMKVLPIWLQNLSVTL